MLAHESADPPRTGTVPSPPAGLHRTPVLPDRVPPADGR